MYAPYDCNTTVCSVPEPSPLTRHRPDSATASAPSATFSLVQANLPSEMETSNPPSAPATFAPQAHPNSLPNRPPRAAAGSPSPAAPQARPSPPGMPPAPAPGRRSGRAFRKNAPPSKRAAPPPPPLPARVPPVAAPPPPSRASPLDAAEAHAPPPPWTHHPPQAALRHLMRAGLAYRFCAAPPAPLAPRKRLRFVPPTRPWAARNPRSAARLALRVHHGGVQYGEEDGGSGSGGGGGGEGWVPERGSMLQVMDYCDRVAGRLQEGQSPAQTVGAEVGGNAKELLSTLERRMLQAWESGVRLPAEDWEGMVWRGGVAEPEAVWRARARCLNEIYWTDAVDEARAREWWERHAAWRPLVRAMQKRREMRYVADVTACRAVYGGLRRHAARCMAYLDGKNEDLDRCVDVFERRLAEVNDAMEKADKTPRSPARKKRRHEGEAPDGAH